MSLKKIIKTSLSITAASTAALYVTNKLIEKNAIDLNTKDSANGSYYDWIHGKIYYTKSGEGAPLLLVHNLDCASSSAEWKETIELLSTDHTVYALDLLGCGYSDKSVSSYTNFIYVELIKSFVKDIIGSSTDVIVSGNSIAFILMANQYDSHLFNHICLVNPISLSALSASPTLKDRLVTKLLKIPVWGTSIYNAHYTYDNLTMQFIEDYYNTPANIDGDIIDEYYKKSHIDTPLGKYLLASKMNGYINANILPCLKSSTNPISIIYGEGSENQHHIVEQYKAHHHSIKIEAVASSLQLPQLEHPHKFVDAYKKTLA